MIRLYGAKFSISLVNRNVQQPGSNNVINNMNLAIVTDFQVVAYKLQRNRKLKYRRQSVTVDLSILRKTQAIHGTVGLSRLQPVVYRRAKLCKIQGGGGCRGVAKIDKGVAITF